MMNWRDIVGSKLMTPAEAVSVVKSGDQVMVGIINCTPYTLCEALYERRSELEGVRIDHPAPLFSWLRDGDEARTDFYTMTGLALENSSSLPWRSMTIMRIALAKETWGS